MSNIFGEFFWSLFYYIITVSCFLWFGFCGPLPDSFLHYFGIPDWRSHCNFLTVIKDNCKNNLRINTVLCIEHEWCILHNEHQITVSSIENWIVSEYNVLSWKDHVSRCLIFVKWRWCKIIFHNLSIKYVGIKPYISIWLTLEWTQTYYRFAV